MDNILLQVRESLQNSTDERTQKSSQRFFREEIKYYGVKTGIVTTIGKEHFRQLSNKTKKEIFDLCENLWQSGMLEESFIACNWAYSMRKEFDPSDFSTFERWIDRYIKNWASCDTFCNHTMGEFIQKYPDFLPRLKHFARSDNRWVRRAAAVSLIVPARKGLFLKEILEIADLMLLDQDDLVRKGYGWMLKVASQVYRQEIFDYVMRNKASMPRTALRYAIEKLPQEMKRQAMAK